MSTQTIKILLGHLPTWVLNMHINILQMKETRPIFSTRSHKYRKNGEWNLIKMIVYKAGHTPYRWGETNTTISLIKASIYTQKSKEKTRVKRNNESIDNQEISNLKSTIFSTYCGIWKSSIYPPNELYKT